MQQLVRVQKCNDDGTATVLCMPKNACIGSCPECSGCGRAGQRMLLKAQNPIGAQPGQVVSLREKRGLLLVAVAFYLLPLILLCIGYLFFGRIGGCLGLLLGVVIAWVYHRLITGKNSAYIITGFAYVAEPTDKGDNDLD